MTPADDSGSVTFQDAQLGALGQEVIAQGAASLSVAGLLPGLHSVSAVYPGDANHQPSFSPAIAVTINRVPSSLVLSPLPSSVSAGTPLKLAVSILPASATGLITFRTLTGVTLGQT
jgi:hypothetical protein